MKKICVLGAGTMGAGIAQTFAVNGYEVIVRDIEQRFVDNGIAGIDKNLSRLVDKNKMTQTDRDAAMGRISGTVDMGPAADCDLIVEPPLKT